MELCCVNYQLLLSTAFTLYIKHTLLFAPPHHLPPLTFRKKKNSSQRLISLTALQWVHWLQSIVSFPFPIDNPGRECEIMPILIPCCGIFFFPFAKPLCGAVQQQLMASSGDITQANRAVNLTDRTRHPEKKKCFFPPFFSPLNTADLIQLCVNCRCCCCVCVCGPRLFLD